MNILLIEDDEDIRELIAVILETKLRATVVQAGTVQEGLAALGNGHTYNCIFSDFHLPDGNGDAIFKAMHDSKLDIPFILCTTETSMRSLEYSGHKITDFIEKPFNTDTLVNTVGQVLKKFPREESKGISSEYCPIRLKTLLKSGVLTCDFFVKISDSHFVKLVQSGDSFGMVDYEHYHQKKLDTLYVRVSALGLFIDKFSQDALSLSNVKALPPDKAFEVSQYNFEIVQQAVASLGFTQEVQTLAQSSANLAIRTIAHDPATLPYFKKILSSKENYLSTHSILLAQVSCYLASLLGWMSETTQYKLALASFLHDITISRDPIALEELSLNTNITETDSKKIYSIEFMSHPLEAAKLVLKMKSTPSDVDSIISAHHERPNGKGFPNHLQAPKLGPLPSLFIVAHDLTNYFWLREKAATLFEFVSIYKEDYTSHHFKRVLEVLNEQVSKGINHISG